MKMSVLSTADGPDEESMETNTSPEQILPDSSMDWTPLNSTVSSPKYGSDPQTVYSRRSTMSSDSSCSAGSSDNVLCADDGSINHPTTTKTRIASSELRRLLTVDRHRQVPGGRSVLYSLLTEGRNHADNVDVVDDSSPTISSSQSTTSSPTNDETGRMKDVARWNEVALSIMNQSRPDSKPPTPLMRYRANTWYQLHHVTASASGNDVAYQTGGRRRHSAVVGRLEPEVLTAAQFRRKYFGFRRRTDDQSNDQPLCLTVKRHPETLNIPNFRYNIKSEITSGLQRNPPADLPATSSPDASSDSILRCILIGKATGNSQSEASSNCCPNVKIENRTGSSIPHSGFNTGFNKHIGEAISFQPGDTISTNPCRYSPESKPLPVSSSVETGCEKVVLSSAQRKSTTTRVSAWLDDISTLASSYHQLSGLSPADRATLLRRSRFRLLLLYMAEADFRFDVEPADAATTTEILLVTSSSPSAVPSDAVREVRRFIEKCQPLQIDESEFHCLKLIVLFNCGDCRLERPDIVRRINDLACRLLYNIQSSRPEFVKATSGSQQRSPTSTVRTRRRRYAELLLRLRALHGVDDSAVRRLFGVSAEAAADI